MSDSWESFLEVLREECATFQHLNQKAIELSEALVENVIDKINGAQDALDRARKSHVAIMARRRGMQQRGFGGMPLRTVAAYAPPHLVAELTHRATELTHQATSLEIINNNNRALILGGMERLMNVVTVMQRAQAQPMPYKRRGIMPPIDNAVIMSQKA